LEALCEPAVAFLFAAATTYAKPGLVLNVLLKLVTPLQPERNTCIFINLLETLAFKHTYRLYVLYSR
jgi:hypothetical protein